MLRRPLRLVLAATAVAAASTPTSAALARTRPAPAVGTSGPIAVADLDGDRVLDLAYVDGRGVPHVRHGDGRGGFAAPSGRGERARRPASGVAVAAADLDGDRRLDLALADGRAIDLWRGDGHGHLRFRRSIALPYAGATSFTSRLLAGRFDGDGTTDLLASGEDADENAWEALALGRGRGRGGLLGHGAAPSRATGRPIGPYVAQARADLDRDGRDDVVWLGRPSGVRVARSTGRRPTLAPAPPTLPTEGQSDDLALADLDGDGRLDLVTVGQDQDPGNAGARLELRRGLPGGRFPTTPQVVDVGLSPGGLGSEGNTVVAGDVDGDGNADLVSTNSDARHAAVLLGDGAGGLRPVAAPGPSVREPDDIVQWVAADLDRDGRDDLLAVDGVGDRVQVTPARGGGAFGRWRTVLGG